tara:strand:+ start:783 stop:2642 length:1860 start_codon:yes stop_codon:yes gene_type:complete
MPFIGQQPKIGAYKLLDSITTSATATYALTASSTAYFPELAQNLIVSLNGVTQAPISAYTVSGSNIVFASALTSSDVIDYILALGDVLNVGSTTNPALPDLTDVNINTGTLAGTHILGYSTVSSAWVNALPSVWSIPTTSQAISTITWQSSSKSLNITRADATFGPLELTDVAMEDTNATFDDLTCEGSFSVSNSVYTHMTVGSGKTRIHNDLQVDGIVTATTFRQVDTGTNAFSLASNGRITTGENLIVTGGLTVDTNTLVVDSTNNRVNIGNAGTVTPYSQGDNFVIDAGGTDDGMSIIASNSSNIFFGDAAENRAGRILYLHSDDSMRFYTNGNSTKMTIDSNGKVGIGETNPSAQLHITGSNANIALDPTGTNAYFDNRKVGGVTNFRVSSSSTLDTTAMVINSSGQMLMGQSSAPATTPSALMDLYRGTFVTRRNNDQYMEIQNIDSSGSIFYFRSATNNAKQVYYNCTTDASNTAKTSGTLGHHFQIRGATEMLLEEDGDLHVDGDVIAFSTTISDIRLKDNVKTIENGLDKVCSLRGVSYTWNAGSREGKRDLGVIAQEVEAVIPEIVREKELTLVDGESYKTVDYEKLVGVLIEAVKELKEEIDELKGDKK